jgi:hypothetical protein
VTGPEHYREGEKQLADATAQLEEGMWEEGRLTTALAQAHFTAALAAATAMAGRNADSRPAGMHSADFQQWDNVAGVPVEEEKPDD